MKSHSASITVEASFSLSLFLLSMIMLMTPLLILNRSIKISCLLEKNARYLSMYKYLEHYGISKTELNDVPQIETVLTVGETVLEDLVLPAGLDRDGMCNTRAWKSHVFPSPY